MLEYKGFLAKIEKVGNEFKGIVYGINVPFTATTKEKAEELFREIVDKHLPEDD